MIFVTNADGGVSYVSPEWCAFTGRDAASATKHGWLDAVHPDDRETAFSFVRDAHAQQSEYTLRHRLRHADERYVWVVGGAVPSFGPPGHTFLGYLGSLTEYGSRGSEPLAAYGTLARFVSSIPDPTTQRGSTLDLAADHLLIAYALTEQDRAKEMLPLLRQALMQLGRLIACNISFLSQGSRIQ